MSGAVRNIQRPPRRTRLTPRPAYWRCNSAMTALDVAAVRQPRGDASSPRRARPRRRSAPRRRARPPGGNRVLPGLSKSCVTTPIFQLGFDQARSRPRSSGSRSRRNSGAKARSCLQLDHPFAHEFQRSRERRGPRAAAHFGIDAEFDQPAVELGPIQRVPDQPVSASRAWASDQTSRGFIRTCARARFCVWRA